MLTQFSRTELLIKKEGIETLQSSTVAVFGVGGVGGFVVEALARAGIGTIHIIDHDIVSISNLNRQIIATHQTIDRKKVEVTKERILSINPLCNVQTYDDFFLPETVNRFPFDEFDYIVDAVDTVTAKIKLVEIAQEKKIKIISSMGTGNKLHPEMLEITDVFKTSVCPLAKVMRKELKDRGIKKLKVCYSKEIPLKPLVSEEVTNKRSTPGSISFVPSTAGLLIAGEIIRDICSL